MPHVGLVWLLIQTKQLYKDFFFFGESGKLETRQDLGL